MSLPFLKKEYKQTGVMVEDRKPDAKKDEESEKSEPDQGLIACMRDLSNALKAGNHKAAADAFQAAFQTCEMKPHEEGEHISPHSYDAQNQKAAQE